MCGIAGQYNFNYQSVDSDNLAIMNKFIKHRGYDDSGTIFIDSKSALSSNKNTGFIKQIFDIGLTHRRLSIIDLSSSGHQPMSDSDNKIWIVFNGEIYNHNELRVVLEDLGHSFVSNTDTEVLLYAYKEYGISFIKKLRGVFSIAICDTTSNDFFIIRDRLGVKPLYYYNDNNSFYFASEIKALINNSNINRELNHEVLSHYLSFLAIPSPYTLFKGIMKLEPGTYIRIDNKKMVSKNRYWDPLDNKINFDDSEEACIKKVDIKLKNSIQTRMMSDVPIGVFLSGGIDSSLIVAMMSEFSKKPINTMTIGYKGLDKSNEFKFAKEIATKYKTNHHELIIDVENTEELIKEMVYFQDEPIADPVCIPVMLLSKKAKELGISVIQVGEGADEIFAGYDNFKTYFHINRLIWNKSKFLPKNLKYLFAIIFKKLVSFSKFRKYIDLFDFFTDKKELFWSNSHKYYPSDIKKILKKKYVNPYNFILKISSKFKNSSNKNYLSKLAYQELNLRLPELLLMRVDKMTMASCVEGRVPFLDHKLVEYALNIPDDLKIKNNESKYIIKKVAENYLPSHIIYRKKQGFGFPIKNFFKGKFKDFLYKSIFESQLKNEKVINYDFVEEMFKLTDSGKVNYHSHIWSIANLSMWYDLWFSKHN
jgi:asparagine synthase (glutamine-hydrolysing)